jgi:hypothetical protein
MRELLVVAVLLAACRSLPDGDWEPMPDPVPPFPGDEMPRVEPSEPGPEPVPTEPATCAGACNVRARVCRYSDELADCVKACETRERLCRESNAPALCWHPRCMTTARDCAALEACRGGS